MTEPRMEIKDYDRVDAERCPTCFAPYHEGGGFTFGNYRTRPVEVVACQFDGDGDSAAWIMDLAPHTKINWHADLHVMHIHVDGGVLTVVPGDWVIRSGTSEELTVCKRGLFAAKYEAHPK